MKSDKKLRILFIGNSHTYYNDLPALVKKYAKESDIDCEVTMIAHGGWFLKQHVEEPDVRFNIRYGNYDYVVLQEHSHPFGPIKDFEDAVRTLNRWIAEAGARTVIYMTWAMKKEEEAQALMTEVHTSLAEEIGAVLAPVGCEWWEYRRKHPDIEMYAEDGAHASLAGSEFAAEKIWEAIYGDWRRNA